MRSAIRAASQLPGMGLLMWMLPMYLHVNKKSDDDDDDDVPSNSVCSVCFVVPSVLYFSNHHQ